jgi:three-Cys-motif partner protein
MDAHRFGGDWTTEKLERVRKYLTAYTTIFKGNPRARYYKTFYVDAFAGTGSRVDSKRKGTGGGLFDSEVYDDPDADAYRKGSARIALEVEPGFDEYLLIERSPKRAEELKTVVSSLPGREGQVKIESGEANELLQGWCKRTNWMKGRAVVFLDPYGMQVEWETLVVLAKTRAIDLWYLLPLGVAVNRLLPRGRPPPAIWAQAVTRLLGTEEWRTRFYQIQSEDTLFGPASREQKGTDLEQIGGFFVERLKTIFTQVAENPLTLRNSKSNPIYLLCFAAGNPKGAKTAVKIAQDILQA